MCDYVGGSASISLPPSARFWIRTGLFSTVVSSLTECKMISKFNEKALQSLERGIHFFQGSKHDIYGNSCVLGGREPPGVWGGCVYTASNLQQWRQLHSPRGGEGSWATFSSLGFSELCNNKADEK